VSLTPASAQQITVGFTTTDVSAVAPGDYASADRHLTFAPGVTTQAITVAVVGDATFELTETFQVNLSNPSTRRSATARASAPSPTTTPRRR
jgi:hypothetical protein